MNDMGALLGGVKVHTTSGRGFSPEEIAQRALEKIISVGDQSHPAIREQAQAFKAHIERVLVFYLREAQQSERTNIVAKLMQQGREDMAQIIGRL